MEVPTPGYAVGDFRSFYRWSKQTTLIGGVENFTNKRYRDHLDLRLANGATVFQPGINFYFGAETLY